MACQFYVCHKSDDGNDDTHHNGNNKGKQEM